MDWVPQIGGIKKEGKKESYKNKNLPEEKERIAYLKERKKERKKERRKNK